MTGPTPTPTSTQRTLPQFLVQLDEPPSLKPLSHRHHVALLIGRLKIAPLVPGNRGAPMLRRLDLDRLYVLTIQSCKGPFLPLSEAFYSFPLHTSSLSPILGLVSR